MHHVVEQSVWIVKQKEQFMLRSKSNPPTGQCLQIFLSVTVSVNVIGEPSLLVKKKTLWSKNWLIRDRKIPHSSAAHPRGEARECWLEATMPSLSVEGTGSMTGQVFLLTLAAPIPGGWGWGEAGQGKGKPGVWLCEGTLTTLPFKHRLPPVQLKYQHWQFFLGWRKLLRPPALPVSRGSCWKKQTALPVGFFHRK